MADPTMSPSSGFSPAAISPANTRREALKPGQIGDDLGNILSLNPKDSLDANVIRAAGLANTYGINVTFSTKNNQLSFQIKRKGTDETSTIRETISPNSPSKAKRELVAKINELLDKEPNYIKPSAPFSVAAESPAGSQAHRQKPGHITDDYNRELPLNPKNELDSALIRTVGQAQTLHGISVNFSQDDEGKLSFQIRRKGDDVLSTVRQTITADDEQQAKQQLIKELKEIMQKDPNYIPPSEPFSPAGHAISK